jgi:hypothetical protein
MVKIENQFLSSGAGQTLGNVGEERPVPDGNERLRELVGERAKAGTEPGTENHGA